MSLREGHPLSDEMDRPSLFGIALTATPILLVVLHRLWPDVTILGYAALVAVLLVVSLSLTGFRATFQNRKAFSLHFGWTLLILVPGVALFRYYGWIAAAWVLGAYAMVCTLGGLHDRRMRDVHRVREDTVVLTPIGVLELSLYVGLVALGWLLTT